MKFFNSKWHFNNFIDSLFCQLVSRCHILPPRLELSRCSIRLTDQTWKFQTAVFPAYSRPVCLTADLLVGRCKNQTGPGVWMVIDRIMVEKRKDYTHWSTAAQVTGPVQIVCMCVCLCYVCASYIWCVCGVCEFVSVHVQLNLELLDNLSLCRSIIGSDALSRACRWGCQSKSK